MQDTGSFWGSSFWLPIHTHQTSSLFCLQEIAETKLPDLNCTNVEAAMRIIEGTAKNMGLTVEAPNDPEAATVPMAA